jgi:hypothetical protein
VQEGGWFGLVVERRRVDVSGAWSEGGQGDLKPRTKHKAHTDAVALVFKDKARDKDARGTATRREEKKNNLSLPCCR